MGRRDKLAIQRTKLANERTLLAYVRTSIVLFATGITMLRLLSNADSVIYTLSLIFIFASLGMLIVGFYIFNKTKKDIN